MGRGTRAGALWRRSERWCWGIGQFTGQIWRQKSVGRSLKRTKRANIYQRRYLEGDGYLRERDLWICGAEEEIDIHVFKGRDRTCNAEEAENYILNEHLLGYTLLNIYINEHTGLQRGPTARSNFNHLSRRTLYTIYPSEETVCAPKLDISQTQQ